MMAKSLGYCRCHSTGEGCILLCKGALGKMNEQTGWNSNYSLKTLPKGTHRYIYIYIYIYSTRGIGNYCPEPKGYLKKKEYMVPNNMPKNVFI